MRAKEGWKHGRRRLVAAVLLLGWLAVMLGGQTGMAGGRTGAAGADATNREGTTTRVSLPAPGNQSDGASGGAAISADGRYVVFTSGASNLVSNDTEMCWEGWELFNCADVFVHDYQTGQTTRVSVDSAGNQGNNASFAPAISADGRYVAFSSLATNLAAGDTQTCPDEAGEPYSCADIFVHDRQTAQTSLVSVDSAGNPGDHHSTGAVISADGRFVAFSSSASNLVANDTNDEIDIFVHNRMTGRTSRVSVDSAGNQSNKDSSSVTISASGQYVAFESRASNLVAGDTNDEIDIFVHNRMTGRTSRVSVDSAGNQSNKDSSSVTISASGQYVAFESRASNLVAGDTNDEADIFFHDRVTAQTSRVSVDSAGNQGNTLSQHPAISADGRYVTFASRASNLVSGDSNDVGDIFIHDRQTGRTELISVNLAEIPSDHHSTTPAISADGRYVTFESRASNLVSGDTNGQQDIFVHDRQTGQVTRISVDSAGNQGNLWSFAPVISADGQYVAFASAASNLVNSDSNGQGDVFVHNRQTARTTRVSMDWTNSEGNSSSHDPAISADGRYVAFDSGATNLVKEDTNEQTDTFVHDRQTGQTTRVSLGEAGNQGNGQSYNPAISATGRFVAFESEANNLVTGDSNDEWDIFVHDRETSQTTRVSVNAAGIQSNGTSFHPDLSADGRYVTFDSWASNLVSEDRNGVNDVFVHDRETGQTTLISVDTAGNQGNDNSTNPAISADGRYVAFESEASNLVSDDTNARRDIFVHDRQTGETARVSVDGMGSQSNGHASDPVLSAGGRYVAFISEASNLVSDDTNASEDIFIHDRQTRQTSRASLDSRGVQGNGGSWSPVISADGRFVAFESTAGNLVAGDSNDRIDVFLHDRQTGQTIRVSVDAAGKQVDGGSHDPAISAGGRYVAFWSYAANLVNEDLNGNEDVFVRDRWEGDVTIRVSVDSAGNPGNSASGKPAMSADGQMIAFESAASNLVAGDSNEHTDVFVHDRETGETTRVSVRSAGYQGNDDSGGAAISADGRYVVFISRASNLVSGDTQRCFIDHGTYGEEYNCVDVFVHDRQTGQTTRVSVDSAGSQGNGDSLSPAISAGGRYIAFASAADNLVSGDSNHYPDVFIHDRHTGETTLVSRDSSGNQGNGDSSSPAISADGRYVAFRSQADNLVSNDSNGYPDIFVHDRQTGQTTLISLSTPGNQSNDFSYSPAISADGRYVAFRTDASNLVNEDTNGCGDIFVHDRQTGQTTRVSVDSKGMQSNDYSWALTISANGRYVAFESWASNLVSGDTNEHTDIFVHDRQTGQTTRVSVDSAGNQAYDASAWASFSADGRYVAFFSGAVNLVHGDTNHSADIFVHDRWAGYPVYLPSVRR